MTTISKSDTAKLLAYSSAAYQREVDPLLVSVWQDALDGYSLDEALTALREHIKTSTYPAVPAAIIKIADNQRRLTRIQQQKAEWAEQGFQEWHSYVAIVLDGMTEADARRRHNQDPEWANDLLSRARRQHFEDYRQREIGSSVA